MKSFSIFYKEVGGNEGSKCHYATRLDTYGCGCQHDCNYCYAKSLLNFRGLWNPQKPSIADIRKLKRQICVLKAKGINVVRLGGMTDCFQPLEKRWHVTYKLILFLNKIRMHYLIVTKSDLVADDEYINILDKELAHIQITVTCLDDEKYKELNYEKAPVPSKRIEAMEKLQKEGFDVAIRLSPYIPEFIDIDKLNKIKCDKLLVEFLRINHWIKQWLSDKCDLSIYTKNFHGYDHLTFEKKKELIDKIGNKHTVTVCDFEPEYLEYWKKEFNPNKEDCCNLRFKEEGG